MLITVLFVIAENWKISKGIQIADLIDSGKSIHIKEHTRK
jgi:hypothetical protein